ncbi:hypothetical protein [Sphingomonas sp.]|jgi:hypothetical protein|uniref:hypothetical protein n=1 Tax=Sphingomonas sp. TaxID=28214 RepID=UPI002ED95799
MRRTILALALLASGAPAMAQTPDMPPPPPGGSMRGGHGAMMMRADADKDGVITREEAVASADMRFARLDANGDGNVTPDEVRDAREEMRERREQMRAAMRDRAIADGKMPPPPGDRARLAADRDRSPKAGEKRGPRPPMTREALRERAMAEFDRLDADHDGRVDAAELAQMREQWRAGRRPGGPRGDMPPPPQQQQ